MGPKKRPESSENLDFWEAPGAKSGQHLWGAKGVQGAPPGAQGDRKHGNGKEMRPQAFPTIIDEVAYVRYSPAGPKQGRQRLHGETGTKHPESSASMRSKVSI